MSTPDGRLGELRRSAFPHLPGSEFDDTIAELRSYHSLNQPICADIPSTGVTRNRELQHELTAINQRSLNVMQEKHRRQLVGMLLKLKSDMAPELAGAIVDEYVLNE